MSEKDTINEELQDSITMLEQILEVMPEDLLALKGLYSAYLQKGQREKALNYLSRLASVAIETRDNETAAYVLKEYKKFEGEHSGDVSSQIARLQALITPQNVDSVATPEQDRGEKPILQESDLSEELALAWRLYEEGQLSQEEYSSVLHDLTEMSSKKINVPVSVLHVLNDRGFIHMNRIMNHMSKKSNVPCLSLVGFDIPEETLALLPKNIVCHEGALPFGEIGEGLLIAVLNPFNKKLLERVETVTGRRCYTYLVAPEEYDRILEKVRPLLK